jgi:hypothetical protein
MVTSAASDESYAGTLHTKAFYDPEMAKVRG